MESLISFSWAAFVRPAGLVGSVSLMTLIVPRPELRPTAARAEPMTAGMPTPSYAAPHTARPGTSATAARTRAIRSRWPTAYCGRAPPQRCTWLSTGRARSPARSARSASERATSTSSPTCSVASSPARPSEVRRTRRSPPRARTQSHLAKEYVDALTAQPFSRASTGGTRKPDASGPMRDVGGAERQGDDRRRRRRDVARARSPRPAPARPAAGPTGAGGVARTTASAATSSGARVSPTVSRKPAPWRSSGAHGGAGPRLEAAGRRQRLDEPVHPAVDPGEHRPVDLRQRGGLLQQRSADGHRHDLRGGGPRGERPRPAGVHASQQRLHQPVDDLVAEPGRDQRADRQVTVERCRGESRLLAHPREPVLRQDPGGGQAVEVGRHAEDRARQRSQRTAGPDPRGSRGRVHDGQPQLARQVDALGPAGQHRLGPDVDAHSRDVGAAELAAEGRARLEEDDVVVGAEQVRRRQPGDPASHDHDPAHARTVTIRSPREPRRPPAPRPSPMTTTARRRTCTVAALGLAALVTLAGCSGAGGSDASSDADAPAAGSAANCRAAARTRPRTPATTPAARRPRRRVRRRRRRASGSTGSVAAPVLAAERSVISTAVVSLRERRRVQDPRRGDADRRRPPRPGQRRGDLDRRGRARCCMSRLVLRIPVVGLRRDGRRAREGGRAGVVEQVVGGRLLRRDRHPGADPRRRSRACVASSCCWSGPSRSATSSASSPS